MPKPLLQSLEFDSKTEKVYRALLSLTDAPVSRIAKKAGIKRTSAYHILENLMNKGFVSSYKHRGTKRYFAENPQKIKSFFEQKMILADRLIPLLQQEIAAGRGKTNIRIFEGKEGIKSISEESLETKKKLILSIGSSKKFLDFIGGKHGYGQRRQKKSIKIRALRFRNDNPSKHPKLQETKILPENFEFPGYLLVFDNKVGISIFEGEGTGIIIESEQFSKMLRSIFNSLWQISKPV